MVGTSNQSVPERAIEYCHTDIKPSTTINPNEDEGGYKKVIRRGISISIRHVLMGMILCASNLLWTEGFKTVVRDEDQTMSLPGAAVLFDGQFCVCGSFKPMNIPARHWEIKHIGNFQSLASMQCAVKYYDTNYDGNIDHSWVGFELHTIPYWLLS